MKQTILITGANGLLGKAACTRFVKECTVYAVVHSTPQDPIENVHYIEIDFSQNWDTGSLPQDIDAVFHLAQSSKFRDFPKEAMDVFDVNVRSTAMLLDYAQSAGAKRFIYASSGGVYGSAEKTLNENTSIAAHDRLGYYLGSKLCGEILTSNYTDHMHVMNLRFFFMYGQNQNRSMLIPRLVDNVKNGHPITLQGEGGIKINPIHVSDAAECLFELLETEKSCTINVAGPEVVTLKQIAEFAGKLLDKKPVFEIVEGTPSHIMADIDYMKSLLWEPKVIITEGIKELIE